MIQRSYLQAASYFFLFGMFVAGCSPSSSMYSHFNEYRVALDQTPHGLATFFSRSWIEDEFDSVLAVDFPDNLHNLDSARDLVEFGRRVEKVHRYTAKRSGVNQYELTLYYSNRDGPTLKKRGYTYVEEDGKLLISTITMYVDSFGEIPSVIVDGFSKGANEIEPN